jgi:ADP-ribosylglycohydrolase
MDPITDRIRGLVAGGAVGDALGSRYEFRYQSKEVYTGLISSPTVIWSRFQGQRTLELGQVTDDTEMSLALGRSLIEQKGYNQTLVTQSYITWCNDGTPMCGKNTRALFKGISTIRGYQSRCKKIFSVDSNEWTQSNGSLMRCAVLALLDDQEVWLTDCRITNPHENNLSAQWIYLYVVRCLLAGLQKSDVISYIKHYASESQQLTPATKSVLQLALHSSKQDINVNKGWVLNALYAAIYAFVNFDKLQDAFDWVIGQNPGSDADTNAAITGNLFGAWLGYDQLLTEEKSQKNIEIVRSYTGQKSDLVRHQRYTLHDFDSYCQQLRMIR